MKNRRKVAVLAAATLFSVALTAVPAGAGGSSGAAQPDDVIEGQYIVTLSDHQLPGQVADEHAKKHGARVSQVYTAAFAGYTATMSPAAAARLESDPRVEMVTPDRRVRMAAQELPTGVNRVDADRSPTAKINGVAEDVDADVAILDTGIDPDHPDLNVVGGKGCISSEPGYVDRNGHGTHTAGVAGARDNGMGTVGVAPGARLWAVKVLDQTGSGTWSSVICGVDFVTRRARTIDVANLSLGSAGTDGTCKSNPLHRALCRSVGKGVTYTVAAGNKGQDASGYVPAAFDEVITVSALADFDGRPGGLASQTCEPGEVDDTFAYFSNHGPDIDLIAPGYCIQSTALGSGYAALTGTSSAAPHVAGGAALYKATHPSATPAQVKAALQAAATSRWNVATDPDGSPDKLLNVATF